jgi:hypothetical protein
MLMEHATLAARIAHSIRSLIATSSQSQLEEPQRGDTDGTEQREAGLTQKAQEIAERSMNQPVELVTAISSALSTAYEEGKAAGRVLPIERRKSPPFNFEDDNA